MFRSFLKTVFSQSTSKQTKRPSKRLNTRLWVEALEDRLVPASIVWNGAGPDNLASDALNWSGGQLPTSADTIVFNNTSSKPATIDAAFTNSVAGMQITADYNSIVSLAENLAVTAAFAQSGSTLAGANNLLLEGAATLSGGTQTGSGTTIIDGGGSATYSGPNTVTFDGRMLRIAVGGTATVSVGQLVAQNGVVITNNGTLGLQGGNVALADGSSLNGTGQTTISSAGVLTTSGNVDASQQLVENDGTINVTSGLLLLGNGLLGNGGSTAVFNVSNGATLQFDNGTFNANDGTNFAGSGETKVGGGQQAQTLNMTGQIVSSGLFTLDANGAVDGRGTWSVTGVFDWNRGNLRGPGTILVANGATATIAPRETIQLGASVTLENRGTLNWAPDTSVLLYGNIYNYGAVILNTANTVLGNCGYFGPGVFKNYAGGEIQKTGAGVASFGGEAQVTFPTLAW